MMSSQANDKEAINPEVKTSKRVLWVLIVVVLVQTLYPISYNTNELFTIGYQLFYSVLIIAGILIAQDHPWLVRWLVFLGVSWAITATIYTLNSTALWAIYAGYVVVAAFQVTVIRVLARFIFLRGVVTRDVIFAAIAVYLLLGALFVPIYGLIETVTFAQTGTHAFIDSVIPSGDFFPWQSFVYYSYVTLTTLGYGDILPATMVARAVVSIEAIIGVLYTTIVIARLVGIYSSERGDG